MLLALLYLCAIICPFRVTGQPSVGNPRELDSLLQDYAFKGFIRPKTGVVYDGSVPSNLTGIRVAALRVRSGSLRRKGFSGFKEFDIPEGLVEQPYVERLVLVYHDLGNRAALYYSLPGYTFLAPVLGLLAYDASDLSATGLPELDIRASGDPISIRFPSAVESRTDAKCVCFALDGSVEFNNLVRGNNTCSTTKQGHFSIVVESSVAPSPAPSPAGGGGGGIAPGGKGRDSQKAWIISGCVIGGAGLLVVLGLIFGYVRKCRRRKKVRKMEEAAESGVPLSMTSLGYTKAPVAMETRTRPVLENEFVP